MYLPRCFSREKLIVLSHNMKSLYPQLPCVCPGMCLVSIPEEPMFKTEFATSLHKEKDPFTVSIDNLCLRYPNKEESPL